MIIKNDKDLAKKVDTSEERLHTELQLEYVDFATTIESDGYTVIVRMCESDLPSNSKILTYPFTEDEFDEAVSGLQCYADYLRCEGKGKHGNYDGICIDEDTPVLLEDEIAEILDARVGQEICIMKSPTIANRYHYESYEKDKEIVFTIYDALRRHYFVTVGGKNIIDM